MCKGQQVRIESHHVSWLNGQRGVVLEKDPGTHYNYRVLLDCEQLVVIVNVYYLRLISPGVGT